MPRTKWKKSLSFLKSWKAGLLLVHLYCHVIVTVDGVWIGNRIYWTQLVSTLYKWLSHKHYSRSRSSLRCLVTSSNSGRSFASGITSSQAGGHLTPTSYCSNCRLKTIYSESESQLLQYWLFIAHQCVLVPSPLSLTTRDIFCVWSVLV
jgi:hypothetical protein